MSEKTIVLFYSHPKNFEKEMDGRKPNIVRKIEETLRFRLLRTGESLRIHLVEKTEKGELSGREIFRTITDYTEWEGIGVISWKHEEFIRGETIRKGVGMIPKECKILRENELSLCKDCNCMTKKVCGKCKNKTKVK